MDDFKYLREIGRIGLLYRAKITISEAIGVFECALLIPARFDDFLNGDKAVLNQSEKRSLKEGRYDKY